MEPKTEWEAHDSKEVVWRAQLDDRYLIEVWWTEPYQGRLLMWDDQGEGELLVDEETSLAYNAQFGPDVDDVNRWQEKCLEVADERST